MNGYKLLHRLCLAALALVVPKWLQGQDQAREPNIVYILADDMGYGDVSCLNPGSKIQTINLDAVAEQGMTFTDAHTSASVSTPTRYGLMTGRYSWRSPLKNRVLWGYSKPLIPASRETVASLLQDKGYATAMMGKWHLGMNWGTKEGGEIQGLWDDHAEEKVDFTKPITGGPVDLGFDWWYGISASLDFPPYVMIENDRVATLPTQRRSFYRPTKQLMMRGGATSPDFEPRNVLQDLTQQTVEYIKGYSKDEPYFIYMPLNAPHTPVMPREKFLHTSDAGIYGDFIREIDWSVGQVIRALKESGEYENTLFIFTADNGASKASFPPQLEEVFHHDPSHYLRGRKGSLYEGGHRVPFFAIWPGVIEPGSECHEPVCLTDLYATCADLLGESVEPDAGEDSYSILPLLKGNPGGYERKATIYRDFIGRLAIRKGKWKLLLFKENKEELYNLDIDISESYNLIDEYPEVAAELKSTIRDIYESGRSTPGPDQENDEAQWMKGPAWDKVYWRN